MKSYRASTRQHCWYIILSFLVSSTVPATIAVDWDGVSVTQIDYEGLLAFKHALLDPSGYLRGWNGTGLDACSGAWEGIKCAQGQVIVIQLPWHGLGGTISEKIGQLTALRKLNLHDNALQGHVPSTIGLLPNLRGVYLFNNRLSGAIPPSIGNCLHLQTLDLSNNLITGNIPASISNSTSLYRLNLSYNKLVGSIPVGLARVPSLTFLSLHYNNLSGPIPDTWGGLGHHTNVTYHLQIVNLDGNSLSGTVPTSLSRLRTLQEVTLSNNRIGGSIPEELGEQLHMLQRLDLSHNSIGGNFPESLCNVSSLLHLDLEGNQLEDSIPETIGGLKNLTFLSLKRNRFRGQIPLALGSVANLSALDLSDNNLTGEIPRPLAQLTNLSRFNVSNNNLSGAVPLPLAERFDSTSFSGNIQLCGYATSVPCPSSSSSPSPPPSSPPPGIAPTVKPTTSTRKLSLRNIIVLVVVACAALLFVLCCVLLVCCLIRKREVLLGKKSDAAASASTAARQKTGGGGGAEEGGDAGGKLVHFDGPLVFTADDLLCATAEIMGKTGYGTVYKATLEDGNQVAVMRLREKISKNQKEFEAEVAVLGKIRHPNLLPLRAYYLGSKGEKLLVFDYMPKGSLATFLHERGPDTPMIEWGTRMKIATGIARGLLHLHTHESIIHGGLTSVNVLLDDDHNPRITDYGLSRLMTSAVATAGSLGYRAPELAKQKKASAKADVYSLGVVMLELLTGKSPGEAVNGLDLPQWVASIVEEKWTSEVFDVELARDGGAAQEAEMLGALKLALHCVDPAPAARPEVDHVLRQLREMRPELKEEGGGSGGVEEAGTTSGSSACV